jgi:hypothetical protein
MWAACKSSDFCSMATMWCRYVLKPSMSIRSVITPDSVSRGSALDGGITGSCHPQSRSKTPSKILFLYSYYLNSRLLQKIQSSLIRVALLIDNLPHPGIDHHLGAEDARLVSAIERCPLNADAMQCRLNDGILLRVHCPAKLMARARGHAIPRATDYIAVVKAGWRAIVAGGQNSLAFHKEGPHLIS